MRYQTSSIRKNANPDTAAAVSTKPTDTPAAGADGSAGARAKARSIRGLARAGRRARTSRFKRLASHSVRRVPNVWSMKNVVARQPRTAPSVFTP
jgi:hypothetical protein